MLELNLILRSVAFLLLSSTCFTSVVQSACKRGCDLALGSYYVGPGIELVTISQYISTSVSDILKYNPSIRNQDFVQALKRYNLPFRCDCINGEFLAHVFDYDLKSGDTYEKIAEVWYANLTTGDWIRRFNTYGSNSLPDIARINVTVNCSCGDRSISKDYGLFVTYPLRPEDTLNSISSEANLSPELILSYNPNVNFTQGSGLVYIPGRDEYGNYPPLKIGSGLSGGAIGGITVGAIAVVLFLAGCLYNGVHRKKNGKTSVLVQNAQVQLMHAQAPGGSLITSMTFDKPVEFSYEELSTATHDFGLANKIGQGGFGAVYYAELRGQKVAIKMMDMKASRQFLAELKVLTHTNHINLVRLIGYCVEGFLFLVYEYIENGNLRQHLHGSGSSPLPWSTRVQIALDSARGIEYIHEHTVPIHVHCDIKSANILIDKNFHGKVADFGLTRLNAVGSRSRVAGTFGYMPPEYLQYGDVSPKVDVFSFGVVLYELISAKQAIIRASNSDVEPKGLVALFHEVLSETAPRDDLVKVIDLRLGDNYPLNSVYKMAQLAKACTREKPLQRPNMRDVVVALMALSSSTEDLDIGSLLRLMSG